MALVSSKMRSFVGRTRADEGRLLSLKDAPRMSVLLCGVARSDQSGQLFDWIRDQVELAA
jgi:hypothetical protein